MTSAETLNYTMYEQTEEISENITYSSTGCLKSKNSDIILENDKNLRQMGRVHK